jgi:hypothetical protein
MLVIARGHGQAMAWPWRRVAEEERSIAQHGYGSAGFLLQLSMPGGLKFKWILLGRSSIKNRQKTKVF